MIKSKKFDLTVYVFFYEHSKKLLMYRCIRTHNFAIDLVSVANHNLKYFARGSEEL